MIHWKDYYVPVEVKLNVKPEKDLLGQCDQYMYVDEIDLSKDITVKGEELIPYVFVIDTEDVYLYDGKMMEQIYSLDDYEYQALYFLQS